MDLKYKGDKRNYVLTQNDKFFHIGLPLRRKYNEKSDFPLVVDAPDIISLHLHIANKNFEKLEELYNTILDKNTILKDKGPDIHYTYNFANDEKYFFDLFECCFISIIFSYSAVEAFVNDLIPNKIESNNIKDLFPNKFDKIMQYKSVKLGIEKEVKLEQKIKLILTREYQFSIDFNSLNFWNDFCDLIKYRDEIMHMKSEKLKLKYDTKDRNKIIDIKSSRSKFLSDLYFNILKRDIIKSGIEIIKYLSLKTKYPPVVPLEFRDYIPPNLNDTIKFREA